MAGFTKQAKAERAPRPSGYAGFAQDARYSEILADLRLGVPYFS